MKHLLNMLFVTLMVFQMQSQEQTISGIVTGADDGYPLPGVNVIVKGTSTGTQTDFDGKYRIQATEGETLVFSFVGYDTKNIKVGKSREVNVALESGNALEEVVISGYSTSVGYGRTSSVAQTIAQKVNSNFVQALRGQASGLYINQSIGQIGANSKVKLRGNGSISGIKPLYILNDKEISEKEFNKIKTDKIKHVEVLNAKQGSMVYGDKGSKGVIYIKTTGIKTNTDISIINGFFEKFNDELYAEISENKFERTSLSPLSTFSIDVDKASYSNVRRMINNGQSIPADAVKIEEMVNYFNYNYAQPKDEHPFAIHTEVIKTPWHNETKLVRIGLQGKTIPTDDLPPSNLTFLIDVSGSMFSANKLPLLKSAFKLLVNQLRAEDKVSIVVYAGAAGVVLEPTSGDDKTKIMEALNQLSAGGSTAGGAGIELAYKMAEQNFKKNGNNRIILATDGDFNVGVSNNKDLEELIEEKRKSGVFLSVLGFGYGNYKDSKLEILADKGNGNHAYIDSMQEAQKVFVEEFGGTLFTIAKDVKIQIEFNPTKVQAYRLIGYENRLLADEDFIDDTKDAGELGSGHTVTALYEVIPVGVKTTYLKPVADLKYTEQTLKNETNNELFTVKFRYKKPSDDTSIELVHIQNDVLMQSSPDTNFAAAVALFGMNLRKSKFDNNAAIDLIIKLANKGKATDQQGYRAEFIRLVETYQSIQ